MKKLVLSLILSILLVVGPVGSVGGVSHSQFDEDFYAGNDILFYGPEECPVDATLGSGTLVGNSNAEKIWNFLVGNDGRIPVDKRLSPEQAAGVMGNLQRESGFEPDLEERATGIGYGIAQWSFGRRTNLENSARVKGVPVSDLGFQLDYLFEESNNRVVSRKVAEQGYGVRGENEWETLRKQATIEDATVFFHNNFEVSADTAANVIKARGGFANDAYACFKDLVPSSTATTATSPTASATIFIDPGHGGATPQYTDPESGLVTQENPNSPEREEVLDIANRAKAELEREGYKVILSRTGADQVVKFRDRSVAAETAKASLAVSIHTTPGEINEVWPQRVGTYREYDGKRVTFTNLETAQKSEQYANTFAKTRSAAEGHPVSTDPGNVQQLSSFTRAGIASKGNISLVQLWAPNVPWVYNEIAQNSGTAINEARKAAYTKGIIDGVKQSIPAGAPKSTCDTSGASFGGGDLQQTILAYAWPDYKGKTVDAKPEWTAATQKARSEGRYIGGIKYPGIDCGGFTTLVLVDSGFDPNYNYTGKISAGAGPTPTQTRWLKDNWQDLGNGASINVADLRSGDIAMRVGHTFMFAGDISGFNSQIASSSLDSRAPMAGKENPTSGELTWYRKK